MRDFKKVAGALSIGVLASVGLAATPSQAVEITFYRVFGSCEADYGTITDLDAALGECGILQTLANKFNAENDKGIKVISQPVDWGQYYDLLSATYASNSAPDIAFVHRSVLPNYAKRKLFEPIKADLEGVGVDFSDYLPEAAQSVTVNGEVYAMPWDLHTLLYHMNVELFQQAGLVDAEGKPILPSSPEELLAHAKQMKDKTGKHYFAMAVSAQESMPVRLWHSFMAQQGVEGITEDGKANIDTPEGKAALELIAQMFEQGYVDNSLDYAGAEQAFLKGEAAVLVNGTWVVDSYSAQATSEETGLDIYAVTNFPSVFGGDGVWADSSLWAIPSDPGRPAEERAAALEFLKFLNENSFHWSRTGHLPTRKSVIESEEYAGLPQRAAYAGTADIATALPMVENQRGIQDVMSAEFNAIWLADKSIDDVLKDAQSRVERILSR